MASFETSDSMARYETKIDPSYFTGQAQTATIRPAPESPKALQQLAAASGAYADCAEQFIRARDNLNDAKLNWQAARDLVAKLSESEGI